MIDVSTKTRTLRTARAAARLRLSPETVSKIRAREVPKGDPLGVAWVAASFAVETIAVLPDEPERLVGLLTSLADDKKLDLVLTTGGTGAWPARSHPEAMDAVFEREVPGLADAIRDHGRADAIRRTRPQAGRGTGQNPRHQPPGAPGAAT